MKLRDYWNKRSREFTVRAIQDKLLTSEGIRYLLFFDVDNEIEYPESFKLVRFPYRYFLSPNGFHVIGYGVHTANEKKIWYNQWKTIYPKSDFLLHNGTIMPHSLTESAFIVEQAYSSGTLLQEPIIVAYYRDKKVFENFGV